VSKTPVTTTRVAFAIWVLCLSLHGCGSDAGDDGDVDGGSIDLDAGPSSDGSLDTSVRDADAAPRPRDAIVNQPPAECGDEQRAESEECDDGDQDDGDGCDATCHKEPGFNCPATQGACAAECGDRLVVLGEACDDGDTSAGDGCGETCLVEPGWSCLMSGVDCLAAECGDGIVAGGELCDDDNITPGDGCAFDCKIEAGWLCPVAGQPCTEERCGDGIRAGAEACDDGFPVSGDGCAQACDAVEPNYACPDLGGVCTRTSKCGNGLLTSDEQCDDRNIVSGDGCTSTCTLEPGWLCAGVGRACTAAECGDGIVAGNEQCDDMNAVTTDGCDGCVLLSGWACEPQGGRSVCHLAVCGDGVTEGNETCDDGHLTATGNDLVGDGCGPNCMIEPRCNVGEPCRSSCGDGIRLASDVNEQCDDGNLRNGDGCSSTCEKEAGFYCRDVSTTLPETFPLTVVYRDFIAQPTTGNVPPAMDQPKHPDFQSFGGDDASLNMVEATLVGGKPVYTGLCELKTPQTFPAGASCSANRPQTTSKANFDEWYSNVLSPRARKFIDTVQMQKQPGSDAYRNPTFGAQLFPLDTRGWVATTPPAELKTNGNHNFGFTTEIHHWFQYNGGETLTFSGDDDLWVFIGGKLAMDLGGLHPRRSRTISIDEAGVVSCFIGNAASGTACPTATRSLGLVKGNVYEMALFHAERHTGESNFDLTLTGFVSARSVCESTCGDGVATNGEACDDGSVCVGGTKSGESCLPALGCPASSCEMNPTTMLFACAGGINKDKSCTPATDCGGGACTSKNDGAYGRCNVTCEDYGPHCGDGQLQADKGEQCDKGAEMNRGGYDGCTQDCKNGPSCGDGKVDGVYREQCDLGKTDGVSNNVGGYDGCSATCTLSERCGDGVLQSDKEVCDDGMNRSPYGGCGPGCVRAPYCGDMVVDRAKGEQCDLGAANSDTAYGGCKVSCTKGARCGDGNTDLDQGELCDDGNVNNYDGCSSICLPDILI
jgi:fibro-slime domain-containing protein